MCLTYSASRSGRCFGRSRGSDRSRCFARSRCFGCRASCGSDRSCNLKCPKRWIRDSR